MKSQRTWQVHKQNRPASSLDEDLEIYLYDYPSFDPNLFILSAREQSASWGDRRPLLSDFHLPNADRKTRSSDSATAMACVVSKSATPTLVAEDDRRLRQQSSNTQSYFPRLHRQTYLSFCFFTQLNILSIMTTYKSLTQ